MLNKIKSECRICGHVSDSDCYIFREMMFGLQDEFKYFQCSRCRCLQILEAPKDINKYYPKDYYSFSGSRRNKHQWIKIYFRRQRTEYFLQGKNFFGFLFSKLSNVPAYLHPLKTAKLNMRSKILDVGSGTGSYLLRLWRQGLLDLTGVDPYICNDIAYNKSVRVFKNELSNINGEFDFIVMNHSLEHIYDQKTIFADLAQKTSKNGYILIRIPTVSSYTWEHYQEHWVQIDAPRHYYLHSLDSIKYLAENNGLFIKHIEYDSTAFQFYGSEQYKKDIPLHDERSYWKNPGNSIFTKSQIKEFEKESKVLNNKNKGDQVCIYLQKQ